LGLKESQYSIISIADNAIAGLAMRKEIIIGLANGNRMNPSMTMLLYLPNTFLKSSRKAPIFLGLNFLGNHTIEKDPAITITSSWLPNNSFTRGKLPEKLRGVHSSSWPLNFILRSGFGVATIYCGDIFPDCQEGIEISARKWISEGNLNIATTVKWRAISAWAWGLSRAMDYLVEDPDVEKDGIIVVGHSRLGKAALWAGAQDERFAIVISNNSGCGGASLARHRIGESVADINKSYPYWFCDNFKKYNMNEHNLPVDQHELLCLIAPRPVYIATAQFDVHADPMGEFLAAKFASPVFQLFGMQGLNAEKLPPTNKPIMNTIGYHIRRGYHGITYFDWAQFIRFANMHLGKR
jgi:hypothetical protein